MPPSLYEPVPGRTHVPVSMWALMQRLNRTLAKEGEVLKKLRGARYRDELGSYYIVNLARNGIEATDVDPVALGRELGVLAAWEAVREED